MSSGMFNPGSPEAVAEGCTCPILDNAHGRGYRGNPNMFVRSCDCPVHPPRWFESRLEWAPDNYGVELAAGGDDGR